MIVLLLMTWPVLAQVCGGDAWPEISAVAVGCKSDTWTITAEVSDADAAVTDLRVSSDHEGAADVWMALDDCVICSSDGFHFEGRGHCQGFSEVN